MYLRLVQTVFVYLLMIGCKTKHPHHESVSQLHMIDYVDVGKRMQQIRTPYVIDLTNQSKHLIFIGCNHIRDSTDKQFTTIQHQFDRLKPQIAFNEGGQTSEHIHYSSLQNAASKAGETGCLKYLSDRAKIQLLNGDTPDSLEFTVMRNRFPKQELYLYYVMERIVIPYLSFEPQQEEFENYFNQVVKSFVSQQFPLLPEEQSLVYFKKLYLKYTKRPFVLTMNEEVEKFDYVNGGDCHFCAIGRQSKMIRDSILLTKLDRAFDQYDRIIVTFGCGHALAIEPALVQIVNKKRGR